MIPDAAMEISLDRPEPRPAASCPVEDWLAFLGHRWNALLLWHLQGGPRRNSELQQLLLGISPKVLTERLSGLECRGLIGRETLPTFPRSVVYMLTPAGRALVPVLEQIELWARRPPVN